MDYPKKIHYLSEPFKWVNPLYQKKSKKDAMEYLNSRMETFQNTSVNHSVYYHSKEVIRKIYQRCFWQLNEL